MLNKLKELKEDVRILKTEPILDTDSGKELNESIDTFQNSVDEAIEKFTPEKNAKTGKQKGDFDTRTEYKLQVTFEKLDSEYEKIQDALDALKGLAEDAFKKPEPTPPPPAPPPEPEKPHLLDDSIQIPEKKESFWQKIVNFFKNIFKK